MAVVGDRIQVPSKRVGQAPREGVVTGSSGSLLRVTWSSGEESTISPSMGSVVVVGRARARTAKGASTVRPISSKAVRKKAAKATATKTLRSDAKKPTKTAAKKTIKSSEKSKRAGATRSPKRSGRANKRRK